MDCINEAENEFDRRKQLLLEALLLSDLANIIVLYTVTKGQLFEEALLRRHCRPASQATDENMSRLLTDLLKANHKLLEHGVDMRLTKTADLQFKLTDAMMIHGGKINICYRLLCYYGRGICTCQRPYSGPHIEQGHVISYF